MLLIAIAYAGFVSLGIPDGLLGVSWPSIRATFDLRLDALGPLAIAGMAGYLASSASTGALVSRFGIGALLALSCAVTALALALWGAAPQWWVVFVAAALLGAGGGGIDAGINAHVAARHSPRVMSWLHASYGFGATVGPLLMTAVLAAGLLWRAGYLLIALVQVALAIMFGLTRRRWPTVDVHSAAVPPAKARATLTQPLAWLSMLVFFVYTGIEAGAGAWAFTLFSEGRGMPTVASGVWVAVYFASFTIGRVVFGAIAKPHRSDAILRGCIGLAVATTALIALRAPAPTSFIALAITGFALAPVYPFLTSATPSRLGESHTANAVGFQVSAAVLGAALLPAGMGVLALRFGLEAIAISWLVAACALFVLHELLVRARSTPREFPA